MWTKCWFSACDDDHQLSAVYGFHSLFVNLKQKIKIIPALSLDRKVNFKLFNTNAPDMKHSSAVVF